MESDLNLNLPHHLKADLCTTRPAYRQGRKLTAVKVYTVNRESQHLLIYNVPAVNLDYELHKTCERFGEVTNCARIPDADVEEFTCVYHIRYAKVHQARFAKRKLDDMSFFGGVLHVCYAPELETVEETKEKLSTRRKEVSFHLKKLEFPKLFRPDRKGKLKRKIQDDKRSSYDLEFGSTFPSSQVSSVNNDVLAVPTSSQSKIIEVPSQASNLKPVDVAPFKKLIPSKVSRIIFHNKTESKNK